MCFNGFMEDVDGPLSVNRNVTRITTAEPDWFSCFSFVSKRCNGTERQGSGILPVYGGGTGREPGSTVAAGNK